MLLFAPPHWAAYEPPHSPTGGGVDRRQSSSSSHLVPLCQPPSSRLPSAHWCLLPWSPSPFLSPHRTRAVGGQARPRPLLARVTMAPPPADDDAAAAATMAAAAYVCWAAPYTSLFVPAVLAAAGPLGPSTRLLDVATGTGPAAVAAARAGATVLATDKSPEMVALAGAALGPYPAAFAREEDGQAMAGVADGSYDVVLSLFGITTFPDWQAGLAEAVRATAPGGRLVITSWTNADGSAFTPLLLDAYRQEFPAKPPPALGPGVVAMCTPEGVSAALAGAGAERVTVSKDTQTWTGPPVGGAVGALSTMYSRAPFYAALDAGERDRLHARLAPLLATHAGDDGVIRIPDTALVTVAHKPGA